MGIPRRGEKGFTLIELLIVVAILGVLAAVVIPNVGRFLGRGEEEARKTEFHNVSSTVVAMMTDNNITTIPSPISLAANATNNMSAFPDTTTVKVPAAFAPGYLLYSHYKAGASTSANSTNYVNMKSTKSYYTCESDGTIHQYDKAGGTEYKY